MKDFGLRGRRSPVRMVVMGLAGLLAALPAAASPTASRPAMWIVQDADTTIFLFGTFHTLDAKRDWLTPQVAQALGSSDELVLETVVPRTRVAIEAAAKGTKRDADYFKGTAAIMREGRAKGMSSANGADEVLRTLAENGGMPVRGLEDFAAQLATLAKVKASPAPALAVAAPAPAKSVTLDQLLAAWKVGDCRAFAAMLEGFKARSPAAYDTLIAGRNKAWAGWIGERMARPGVVFVAVGSGHLAGKDSVQAQLAAKGLAAHRIG